MTSTQQEERPATLSVPSRAGSWVSFAALAAVFAVIQFLYQGLTGVPLNFDSAIPTVAGGILAALVLGSLASRLDFGARSRFGLLLLAIFIVQIFADLIEGAFFTTRISSAAAFLGGTLVALVMASSEAAASVSLFPVRYRAANSFIDSLRTYLGRRRGSSWTVRIILGGIAYFPIYFFFGALVSPYVIPYYTNPSNGLGLAIPPFTVLVPVELLRGFLFVLCLFPVLAVARMTRREAFLLLTSFLFVLGAFVPFIANTTLPWFLKGVHGTEIMADSLVYSAALVFLFKWKT